MDDANYDGLWTMDLYVMYYGWWMCMWWVMDVYVVEYGCVCDISCVVCWYICDFFVYADGKQKKQKNSIFSLFAECHTRQRGLCRVSWPWHSAKLGSRDPISQLCRVPEPWHSAKIFFKKKKILCRVQEYGTRQRIFKKKEKFLCRVPLRWHSAKRPSELTSVFFAECWRDTRQRLYRVPNMWHSAKKSLPTALCRVRHSAKPLPSVFRALPSAASTRQIAGF